MLLPIYSLLDKIRRGTTAKNGDNNYHKKAIITMFFTGTKILDLDVLPGAQNVNQDHFLARTAPELSKENMNAKQRVGKNQQVTPWTTPHGIIGTRFESLLPGKQ
jgi:hypothetical protein